MTDLSELGARIANPRLGRLYSYWLTRKGARRFPARRDLDPVDLRYALGHMMLFDVLRQPLRFGVRLHGAELAARAQYDLTGKGLDDMPDQTQRALCRERCETIVRTGEPIVARRDRLLAGETWSYEALWLPFSEDGVDVSMLLCAMMYDPPRRKRAA